MPTLTYTLTDNVGDAAPLEVDADVTTAQLEEWFIPGVPADDPNWAIVRLNIDRLARSFNTTRPSWDGHAAEYLGIDVTPTWTHINKKG